MSCNHVQLRLFAEEEQEGPVKGDTRLETFTKEELIQNLKDIRAMGWVENARPGNAGGIGNTLEDLLGIEENNLPIPNAAEWELKTQRSNTTALVTLFHTEPSPRVLRFVPQVLLPHYGWFHKQAGKRYDANERSFRQTINAANYSDRGFTVQVDRKEQKILISFDANFVDPRHQQWLSEVEQNIGLGELAPQPYWGFDDLEHKAGTKLLNCFFVLADVKRIEGQEYLNYSSIFMLEEFNIEGLIRGLEEGFVLVDFDARTGHNHGTKFRLRRNRFPELYSKITNI